MKITHIIWDLEEGDSDYALPKEIDVPDTLLKKGCTTDEILDWASDEYGYCICSCDIG
ncbi:hypothetical protein bpr_II144 (plasmid) [Butyrivibrio proteoclasticus B316]|uniref:Uncharacterized protein n=1 Tax=Butyrivibrio proteoclasticus (strain ATCC 51982 / DSM 14932 / B316) TaxID=515622 RepID=E0S3V0_BUTPB|nr:hypothetical protein [Butyrivibrio proteoclasticus]ADL36082.1 hypothetical protein bpr_II144 [Butyrivibrio proteoclasticus B316]